MPDALLNMTVLSLSRPAAGKHPATPNALVGVCTECCINPSSAHQPLCHALRLTCGPDMAMAHGSCEAQGH